MAMTSNFETLKRELRVQEADIDAVLADYSRITNAAAAVSLDLGTGLASLYSLSCDHSYLHAELAPKEALIKEADLESKLSSMLQHVRT
jgi:hypothetical protein